MFEKFQTENSDPDPRTQITKTDIIFYIFIDTFFTVFCKYMFPLIFYFQICAIQMTIVTIYGM